MILGLSACIGMTLAAFFTASRTFWEQQHQTIKSKHWSVGWLVLAANKIVKLQQRVERWRTTTPNTSSKPAHN